MISVLGLFLSAGILGASLQRHYSKFNTITEGEAVNILEEMIRESTEGLTYAQIMEKLSNLKIRSTIRAKYITLEGLNKTSIVMRDNSIVEEIIVKDGEYEKVVYFAKKSNL